jgi:quercetin dioxygenase-like cupin family protein
MAEATNSGWTAGQPVAGIANRNIIDAIAALQRAPQWTAGDRAVEVLAKNSEMSVTLIVLKRGAALKEHRARGTAVLSIVSGSIVLNGATLGAGSAAVIDREVPHALEAIEDSALVLTAALK